jgi:hypothetical protein
MLFIILMLFIIVKVQILIKFEKSEILNHMKV